MGETREVTTVVFVGLGGQGVIRASDILVDALFHLGWDVKKAEIHGMSQRGGVVTSDVRFGKKVLSPMVPRGEADYVLLLHESASERADRLVRPTTGVILAPDVVEVDELSSPRSLNVALLGALAERLSSPPADWEAAIARAFRPELREANIHAFRLGRRARKVA